MPKTKTKSASKTRAVTPKIATPDKRGHSVPAQPVKRNSPKVTVARRLPLITASMIKPSDIPEENAEGVMQFTMNCIVNGAPRKFNCAEAVYDQIKNEDLCRGIKYDFPLT